jgi:hypothetical protein
MYVFCLFMRVLLSWFPGIDWNAQPWTFLRLVRGLSLYEQHDNTAFSLKLCRGFQVHFCLGIPHAGACVQSRQAGEAALQYVHLNIIIRCVL